jgi:Fe-Mn family superoxide dismutase
MAFTLPPLPYDYSALEPHIDTQTMQIHHDKHHNAYITNLNAALESHPNIASQSIEDILSNIGDVPEAVRQAVINNGGGHANHTLFWESMSPSGGGQPSGGLADAINDAFGSFDAFKEQFEANGVAQFGSGWTWLVLDGGQLGLDKTPNQDNPVLNGQTPLLGNDVWEHAYYLKYQNKRPAYLEAWWDVVNWDKVAERFAAAS